MHQREAFRAFGTDASYLHGMQIVFRGDTQPLNRDAWFRTVKMIRNLEPAAKPVN